MNTTFGFSAFLKLICLSPRRQRSELRRRLNQEGQGYDFHKSARIECRQVMLEGKSVESALLSTAKIVKDAERNSARSAIKQISMWRNTHKGVVLHFDPVTYESPVGLFKVKFVPDFGMQLGPVSAAFHIWNTKSVEMDRRLVRGALALVHEAYVGASNPPQDLVVLSLLNRRMIRLSDAQVAEELSAAIVNNIDKLIEGIVDDIDGPKPEAPSPAP